MTVPQAQSLERKESQPKPPQIHIPTSGSLPYFKPQALSLSTKPYKPQDFAALQPTPAPWMAGTFCEKSQESLRLPYRKSMNNHANAEDPMKAIHPLVQVRKPQEACCEVKATRCKDGPNLRQPRLFGGEQRRRDALICRVFFLLVIPP